MLITEVMTLQGIKNLFLRNVKKDECLDLMFGGMVAEVAEPYVTWFARSSGKEMHRTRHLLSAPKLMECPRGLLLHLFVPEESILGPETWGRKGFQCSWWPNFI